MSARWSAAHVTTLADITSGSNLSCERPFHEALLPPAETGEILIEFLVQCDIAFSQRERTLQPQSAAISGAVL